MQCECGMDHGTEAPAGIDADAYSNLQVLRSGAPAALVTGRWGEDDVLVIIGIHGTAEGSMVGAPVGLMLTLEQADEIEIIDGAWGHHQEIGTMDDVRALEDYVPIVGVDDLPAPPSDEVSDGYGMYL